MNNTPMYGRISNANTAEPTLERYQPEFQSAEHRKNKQFLRGLRKKQLKRCTNNVNKDPYEKVRITTLITSFP